MVFLWPLSCLAGSMSATQLSASRSSCRSNLTVAPHCRREVWCLLASQLWMFTWVYSNNCLRKLDLDGTVSRCLRVNWCMLYKDNAATHGHEQMLMCFGQLRLTWKLYKTVMQWDRKHTQNNLWRLQIWGKNRDHLVMGSHQSWHHIRLESKGGGPMVLS